MSTSIDIDEDPQTRRARARVGMLLQDKWRLEAVLGLGGMAAVYAATHRNGKRVAVKILHAEFSHDEDVRTRFLQEGYAANAIQHEGAVSVLDDDLAPDGSAFLVMELLEGETVEQRWETRGRKLSAVEVLSIADQLLGVLAAAHAKSVVHRDIKPENLFVTHSGVLKVLDFGIAKVFEPKAKSTTATRIGMVMGTPAFMAPEQARARWDEVDGKTDLWAVGATMFTLLSGRYVHEADSNQEQLILSATVPALPLASVAPDVPLDVADIVDRALVFDRAGRFADALSMRDRVRASLEGLGGHPAPVSSQAPTPASTETLRSHAVADLPTSGITSTAGHEATKAESTRIRAALGEAQQRYEEAKKRTAETHAALDAAIAERKSLEEWFERRVGTRTTAVTEARTELRAQLIAFGRRALADELTFGAEFAGTREQIARLGRGAEAALRDVNVHRMALDTYDRRCFRAGLAVLALGALAALAVAALVITLGVWWAKR